MVPQELEIDKINAVTRNLREGDQEDKEFERRMKIADTLLKEKQIQGKENANRQRTPNDLQQVQRTNGAAGSPSAGTPGQGGGFN